MAALGGALFLTVHRADRTADESIDKALNATQAAIDDALTGRSEALLRVTAGLAQVPDYVARLDDALRRGERSNLLDQADEFRDQTGATWALIADERGTLQAWTHDRLLFGDDLSESSLVGLALAGDSTQGAWIEPGPEGDVIFQTVGVPIFDPTRTTIYGVLLTALEVDAALAAELKRHTNSDVVFFAVDTLGMPDVVVSTLATPAIDTAMAGLYVDSAFGDDGRRTRLRLAVERETLVGVVGPLLTASGFPVGGYVGFRSRDAELAGFTALRRTMLFVFVAGLALALLAAFVMARQITRPLKRLVDATRRVGEGEYSGPLDVQSRDEVGTLASAFQQMMRELKAKEELVQYLSSLDSATLAMTPDQQPRATAGPAAQTFTGVLPVGQILADRYEIRQVLGQGGMGMVYRAYDRELDEQVAIKTLKPEVLESGVESLERFRQEIRLARRITHRNVVRTHDIGQVEGMYFITMEFVEGTTLKQVIRKRGQLPVNVVLTVGKQLCRAMDVAHQEGIIHRDIKPQNMVVDARGFLKVMDFGIARLAEAPQRPGERLTEAGAVVGTVDYMAPEQLMGGDIDHRVDLYAAGAVLWECVAGRPVFEAPTVMAVMARHLEEEPEDPVTHNAKVPKELSRLILKALSKERDDRQESAKQMRQELEAVRAGATSAG